MVVRVCCRLAVPPPGSPVDLLSPPFSLQTPQEDICLLLRQRAVPGEQRVFGVCVFCLGGGPALQSSAVYVRFFLLCLSIPLLPVDACLVEASQSEKMGLSFAAFRGNLPASCLLPERLAEPGQTWGSAQQLCQGLCELFPAYPNAGMKACGPLPRRHCCTTGAAVRMGRWRRDSSV